MDDNSIVAESVLYALSLVVQTFSIITIGRYDPAHSSGPMLCPTWPDHRPWTTSWQTCKELKNYPSRLASYAFDDPSTAAFGSALVMFTLAALYTHTTHREGRSQTRWLLVGIAAAAVMSSTRWFLLSDESLAQSMQICLPMNVMLSSVVGTLTHRMRLLVASRGQIYAWQQRKELVHETTRKRRVAGFMKETEIGQQGRNSRTIQTRLKGKSVS